MDTNSIYELEKILNQEIEAYSKLEEYISGKKQHLVNGDIEKIRIVDLELEKYNYIVEKLEEKRKRQVKKLLSLLERILQKKKI